ncbi:MAG: acetolactate decarboxylase [Thermodesulfobacteriota bacterium]
MRLIEHAMVITAVLFYAAVSLAGDDKGTIFQISTIDALMEGVYDGDFTFSELKKHGDFGLGTLNDLDGEMIGLGGVFYQVRSDGKVHVVPDTAKTPFAAVTFFEPGKSLTLTKPLECKELESYIETLFPSKNIFYALKIEGSFDYVKTRSVPKQERPFPPLTEVVKHESFFEFKNVKGTMVGFWFPEYLKDINTIGFHLHFLTEDKKAGGHVLDCAIHNVSIGIDSTRDLDISLPETTDFYNANLTKTKGGAVNEVENGKN